jgi:SAM-dependent methyltransferase
MNRMAEAENYNDWLLDRARPYLGSRVLDFGAGIGTLTEAIAPGRHVVALEPDPAFVPRLQTRFAGTPDVAVVAGDDASLERLDETFDTILCFNVLEHVRDDERALGRFHAQLAPGGHVLLLVPAHQALFGEIDRRVGHERRYNRALLGRRLRGAGFEVLDARYVNPVGALGWLVTSRLLRRTQVPTGPLKLYDALVPLLRSFDRLPLPFGLSVWAVGRRASS